MTVATKVQPNYTTQQAAAYKAAIDGITAIHDRIAGAFAPHEQDVGSPSPDLSMRVDAGYIFSSPTLTEVAAQTVSGFTTPSAGQERIDRVVIDASTGAATRVAGTAVTGSPSAVPPAIPTGKLPCCQIRFTDASTAILNSMITDERAGASASGSEWVLGTAVATTSGTTKDYTGLPANVAEIIVMFYNVSSNGSSSYLAQLGDSGGIENTGYNSQAWQGGSSDTLATSSAGFLASAAASAARNFSGCLRITRLSGNKWVSSGVITRDDGAGFACGGVKELSAELTQIRITTVSADTFGAGEVNILYRVAP